MPYELEQIDPTKTVVIVVDMQNDFVAEGAKLRSAAAAAMVPKLPQLSSSAERRASGSSTWPTYIDPTGPTWAFTMTCIHRLLTTRPWSMERLGVEFFSACSCSR